jgi:uncharacterized surface protein with fasciclin (FAS1) repeats
MKSRFFRNTIGALLIIAFFACIFSACTKTKNTVPIVNTTSTLSAIIKHATNLTIFDSALSKTNLLMMLDSANGGPYTVIAPPDLAFTSIQIVDSTLYKIDTAFLRRIMLYHLIGGQTQTAATIAQNLAGPNSPYASMGGDILYFSVYGGLIYVNGNQLTQTDVTGVNGVIHAVNKVLIPPTGNLYQTLQNISTADTTCTQFLAALNYASTGSTLLDSTLANGGTFTVFIPNNAAFRAYYNDTLNVDFTSLNPDTVANLLKYHIVPNRVFTSDVANSTGAITLTGDSLRFYNTVSLAIGKTDSTYAGFNAGGAATNIMANNGVLHKITGLLAH